MSEITTITGADAVATARGTLSRGQLHDLLEATPAVLPIATKYQGATNYRAARIGATVTLPDGTRRRRSMLYRHELGAMQNHLSVALQLLTARRGVNCSRQPIGVIEVPGGWTFIFRA